MILPGFKKNDEILVDSNLINKVSWHKPNIGQIFMFANACELEFKTSKKNINSIFSKNENFINISETECVWVNIKQINVLQYDGLDDRYASILIGDEGWHQPSYSQFISLREKLIMKNHFIWKRGDGGDDGFELILIDNITSISKEQIQRDADKGVDIAIYFKNGAIFETYGSNWIIFGVIIWKISF